MLDHAELYDEAERRRRRAAYRYSVRRRLVDWRDDFLLDHPRVPVHCRRALCSLALVALVALLWRLGGDVVASQPRAVETLAVVERLELQRPPANASAPLGECTHERLAALRFVRHSAELVLDAERRRACVCAPMFGVAERLLSLRIDGATVHAFNASVRERACDGADTIERWYVNESAALAPLFGARHFDERLRAACVDVEHVDAECRRARLLLAGAHADCAQLCADLFDARYQ